ncbi:MAG: hypothetical protein Q8918_10750 [Bacteroidota bacterium]|nr:hypothetical protein [Bacteroidota bacterium]MDP4212207.1 hypothetical protein [Bacteroidota bacterium]MDP4250575.1 hypothetical protein [Bacteroidota bacterium]
MKKNLSGIILVAEIVAVILFHAFKLRESEQAPSESTIVMISKNLVNIPKSAILLKTKPDYFFINMLK